MINKFKPSKGAWRKEYYRTWFVGLPLRWNAFVRSLKCFKDIHLMDNVIYNGELYFVNNAVKCRDDGTRLYDILKEQWNEDGKRDAACVPASEFKKAKNWCTFKNSYLFLYKHYMTYWYIMDVRKKLLKENQKNAK